MDKNILRPRWYLPTGIAKLLVGHLSFNYHAKNLVDMTVWLNEWDTENEITDACAVCYRQPQGLQSKGGAII